MEKPGFCRGGAENPKTTSATFLTGSVDTKTAGGKNHKHEAAH